MPTTANIKPTQKPIKDYYAALRAYAEQGVTHESALRSAFQNLLAETGRRFRWTLIPELSEPPAKSPPSSDPQRKRGASPGASSTLSPRIRPDGTFRDDFYIERGYWEAKDTADDLEAEIKKKTAKGYPLTNTVFEDTRVAVLFQNGRREMEADLTKPQELADLLNAFFSHTEPAHDNFEKAVGEFKQRVPDLARGLVELIADAHKTNPRFIKAFGDFFDLCKSSLNPNLSAAAVDEMLVQHLLTERLIRTIFDNQDFTRRNVIAAEVEKVIDALVSKSFNRHEYLRQLDRFYLAIEAAAATIGSFAEKQHFLNVVYERFFQGYSVKLADTHGIVYTPQEIVDFMCASVEEVLKSEFGKSLGDKDVHILDPCTGTGNFIVNLLRRIPKRDLPRVYKEQLFANEVMLLPYYIAALNIEHAYFDQTAQYEPFEGLCFVDSLDLAEGRQADFPFMTEENAVRVQRQKKAPITVIIGNPPYNVGQLNENDNNKNRSYKLVERRIQETYSRSSNATLKNKLYDPYIKFFRWATDRLEGRPGIVCFVSNNNFVDQHTFDGLRQHLRQDFHRIVHIDLNGNVRLNPKLSGTTHNVFGIQVGVGVTLAIRLGRPDTPRVEYCRVPEDWRREQKLRWLSEVQNTKGATLRSVGNPAGVPWTTGAVASPFGAFVPIGTRAAKGSTDSRGTLFKSYSLGVNTSRDAWVYAFSRIELGNKLRRLADNYNYDLIRTSESPARGSAENTNINRDSSAIKWTDRLLLSLRAGKRLDIDQGKVRNALYRPFTVRHLYFDELLIQRRYQQHRIFPSPESEQQNCVIVVSDIAHRAPGLSAMVSHAIPDYHVCATTDAHQCFPCYTYDEDGSNRRENITDWALKLFRDHYGDKKTTKWDIFHYVYGVLHHRAYREKFADNLKRDLPRIPLAASLDDFRAFRDAGKALAKLHLDYESLKPWPLKWIETPGQPLSYRVQKMKLTKDRKTLVVNDSLALEGIPPEVFDYRLGNRSALDWVIDQYQVSTDKRSGITSDPNRPDDPEYIVRLVGQVVRVSVETVNLVNSLPKSYGGPPSP